MKDPDSLCDGSEMFGGAEKKFANFVRRAAARLRSRPDLIQALTVITLAVLEETTKEPKRRKPKKKTKKKKVKR